MDATETSAGRSEGTPRAGRTTESGTGERLADWADGRLMHVLVLPGIILGLMVAHLALVFHHKHTQFPGPGRDEKSVVRIAFFVAPVLAFVITRRVCLGLQRRDRDTVLHGRETGTVRRLPHGEYVEVHEPLSQARRFTLTQHEQPRPYEAGPRVDANGVARRERVTRRADRKSVV